MVSFQEYYELLHEFMTAVKQNYGEKVLVQVCTNFPCMVYVAYKPIFFNYYASFFQFEMIFAV